MRRELNSDARVGQVDGLVSNRREAERGDAVRLPEGREDGLATRMAGDGAVDEWQAGASASLAFCRPRPSHVHPHYRHIPRKPLQCDWPLAEDDHLLAALNVVVAQGGSCAQLGGVESRDEVGALWLAILDLSGWEVGAGWRWERVGGGGGAHTTTKGM